MNSYPGWAGLGFGIFFLVLLVYLGILALALWIGYLIMRTAVKNGILLADAERMRGGRPGPYGYPGPQPPHNPQSPPSPQQPPSPPSR